ncbi:EAL domain-containing protein [Evansella sp. AB-rgal1]|uniref:sensor domain-containing phosphodiesterase n=1 Tax=Evansella sp. AB-rgal1 TaxID=3242696 RepID=UPI00359DE975
MENQSNLFSIFKVQSKIIEMISMDNLPLEKVLRELIHTIDYVLPNSKSSIFLVDENKERLVNGIGPKLQVEYLKELDGFKIGANAGCCGTAAFLKKTVVVEDASVHSLWENYSYLVNKYAIQACWSMPLLSSTNELLGTIAFYCDEKRKPTKSELEIMEMYSKLAALIITKKQTEDILYLSNTVVENSPVVLMRWKATEGWPLEYVTNNVSIFGYKPHDFIAGKILFASIIYPNDMKRVEEEVMYYSSNGIDSFSQEYRIITKDGSVKWIDDRTIILRDKSGNITHYQGTLLDITARKEAEETIKYLADNDPLTQLPNRRVFMEQLCLNIEKAKRNKGKLAILFLDLDNFKDINDVMGHYYGDLLLHVIAGKLKAFYPNQCFISRVSGDEFAFIYSELENENDVEQIAQALLQIFSHSFQIEKLQFQITASIGISLYPTHGKNPDELLKQADLAMYSAKNEGKNNFQLYTTDLYEKTLSKKQLHKELEIAIKENQFILYYQPKINIQTLEITGVEALIRWNHPSKGIISPAQFIPLAEETGLIFSIDDWVLREACQQLAAWREEGLSSITISVNISSRQFYNKELVTTVMQLLLESKLDPHHLTLEMTESTLMTDKEKTITVLNSLKQVGVYTSLDDFGTGYSSLSYLKYLPINKLKIDRSFISEIANNTKDAAIVESIFALATNLNLDIIVEGIETKEQLQFLGTRCIEGQGFLFSPPIPADEFYRFYITKQNWKFL